MNRRGFLGMAAGMAVLGGGASLAQAKKLRIAFANFNDESSFGAAVLKGFQATAKGRPDVEMLYFDNKQDAARAVDIARNVATLRPDVFLEYQIVPAANQQVARIVREAGIPCLGIQVRLPGYPLYAVDNYKAGFDAGVAAAEQAGKRWGGTTRALILSYPEGGPLFLERQGAVEVGLKKIKADIATEIHSTKNDPGAARQITADYLTRNPGKIAIYTHVDAMAIGALAAARAAGREGDIVISSFGGDAAVLPELRKDGAFIGTFTSFPETWGETLLDLAAKIAARTELPDLIHPPQQLMLTPANVAQYYPA
ncbi:sugar ABC transporter substrate-binding protein [Bradyrhizobium sp. U87765 SZCCT0131]|uniref:sugar ABC transporter substrate-binding protein n=1 Tax=unclassified Bradyrhizobium TaxID=2631580 RepID=UPI001BAAF396|nr:MULTISPECIES: sugar ABC transporter substrate-binding protein [unclassified Bradyrhizobium]MBR1222983.1 sugar ABC transporter substrate-binding protein [Bradyrhizobium sp. U87765 SZCCT0131]MBR1262719.1 sugar ABC transporter substrate-binding protein [Bradyrhizobium sp. U87765 SZCCT0134]MBR1308809.1 sugar ABC transporter substrate-binding protein [Bradyrhizobium sp. U87765 SZCCT0110]MBR1318501.1 sugar ABC transporter substrate-binding protein [Bradyrhizobium sp. U87765 SZCCT0109]MBR1352205.1